MTYSSCLRIVLGGWVAAIVMALPVNSVWAQSESQEGAALTQYSQAQDGAESEDAAASEEATEDSEDDSVAVVMEVPDDLAVVTLTGDHEIEDMKRRILRQNITFDANTVQTLFFSKGEHDLIVSARRGLITRPPADNEPLGLSGQPSSPDETEFGRASGIREIYVGGIVYVSSNEWVVWLNGQKITPDRLPPEVYDIRVYKDYVKLKWYDVNTNAVYPIKLKTQQRFNIDTRIFLPG